ncbi:unnamed protein product [Auanema sp. JU1783]|nr:unnamed protein product [Auanema sp. JU1783]
MAVLGFHVVISLIVLTLISKLGTRISIIQLFIVKGLYRYLAPTNNELRSLLPSSKEKTNPRLRRRKREEEDMSGFNVPKHIPLSLNRAPVNELELQNFPLFTSVHWLSLYVPLCLVTYVLSEVFLYYFPSNGDMNISIIWLFIGVAFVMQVLARLTAWLIVNQDERSLLFTFGALYFLISCIFTMWSNRFFDVDMLKAYDQFGINIDKFMEEIGNVAETDGKLKSPLLLYISLSVLFSLLSAMLVFPNFRFANMYTRALEVASVPSRIVLHLSFLMPLFTLTLYLHPVKAHLVHGKRMLFTEESLDIFRIYTVIFTLLLRLALRKQHLQAHLDMPHEKVQELQKETGHVRNTALQSLIFRYYSYFSAVVLQYFSPILLAFFFALLLKTTGGLSWVASPQEVDITSSTVTMGAIRSIFDQFICRSIWTYALIITTFINFSLSMLGVMYNTYFAK